MLEESEVLFPCHKSLLKTISDLENKPISILEKVDEFLQNLDNKSKDVFVNSILDFIKYKPPENYSIILTRFIDDNKLWWYKERPVIAEW